MQNTTNNISSQNHTSTFGTDVIEESDNGYIYHFIVMTIQPSIGTMLTLIAILVIVKHKRLLHRISNKFLLNLFMANCFASFSMVGYAALALYHITQNDSRKNLQLTHVLLDEEVIFYIVVVTSMVISLINRMAVTLDRVLAIKRPFFYAEKFTTRVFFKIVCITLTVSLTYFLTLIICYWQLPMKIVMLILQISFVIVIIVGFIVLAVVNFIIFFAARFQLRAIAGTSGCPTRKKQLLRREYRIVCICAGIVLTFELCWTPVLVWFMYNLVTQSAVPNHFQFTACHLICLNNILDPLVYGWLSKDVKSELKSFFFGKTKRQNTPVECNDMSVTINFTTYSVVSPEEHRIR